MSHALESFVRDALRHGQSRAAIRDQLTAAGWRADEVDAALGAWAESDFPIPVPRRRASLSAREAFLHLVLFATLYTAAFNAGQVLFALVDRLLPDPIDPNWLARSGVTVRNATAGLLIAFPVFLVVSRVIGVELARAPDQRGSKVRRWLTYLTLFLAACVLIGDLIALVSRLLAGEVAMRFLLKVAVVFAIAATAGIHYLADLRRVEGGAGERTPRTSPWARLAALAMLAVAGVGLGMSGSPAGERLRTLDEKRVEDLMRLNGGVDAYWRVHGALPPSIDAMLADPQAPPTSVALDPQTREPYAYSVLDSTAYQLCARFQTADNAAPTKARRAPADGESRDRSVFWRHHQGVACFTFRATREPARP